MPAIPVVIIILLLIIYAPGWALTLAGVLAVGAAVIACLTNPIGWMILLVVGFVYSDQILLLLN